MRRGALIALLSVVVLASPAAATNYTVGTTSDPPGACASDPCSLRQLIARIHASPFPPDTITVPAGTYTLDAALGELVITKNMSIVGAGASTTTIAMPIPADRANEGSRVFNIQAPPPPATTPTVEISGVKVEGGTAHPGNGFFGGNILSAGTLTLRDVWVANGSAYSGGGVANVSGTLTIDRSLVAGNGAPYGGGDSGGIENFGVPGSTGPPATPDLPGHLVVNDSTVTGNHARLVGGIFSWNDDTNTLVVSNSTIAGNMTMDEPGGPARDSGGGLGVGQGTEVVRNSIVADNVQIKDGVTTSTNCGPIASGGITSLGHNIDSGSDCHFSGVGDLSDADPLLGPLRDNGGPTQTLALRPGSPALDRIPSTGADCAATDQRGVPRPQGPACDIGAFEVTVVPVNTSPPTIGGSPVRGQTLTESHGAWAYGPTAHAYQWLRCNASGTLCAAIPGATSQSYALTAPDVGSTLRVEEVASNAFGSGSPAGSAPTAVVTLPRLRATVRGSYLFFKGGRTRIKKLFVSPLPVGTTVVLTCRSPRKAAPRSSRCPFKKKTIRVRKAPSRLQLAKHFKKRTLARNTKIQIRARREGYIGLAVRLTTRRLKVPVKRSLCLPPRTSRPVKC